jgi:hypothetical protein
MERGLVDADLGGGVVKKRVALPGRGKRGGARTLVVTNHGDRWFFVYGFEKSVRANILAENLEGLREIAKQLLDRTSAQLDQAVRDGSLQERGRLGSPWPVSGWRWGNAEVAVLSQDASPPVPVQWP